MFRSAELELTWEQDAIEPRGETARHHMGDQSLYLAVVGFSICKKGRVIDGKGDAVAFEDALSRRTAFAAEQASPQFNDKAEAVSLVSDSAAQWQDGSGGVAK